MTGIQKSLPLEYSLQGARIKTVSSLQYQYSGYERQHPGRYGLLLFQYTLSGAGKIEIGTRRRTIHDLPPGAGFIALTPGPHRHWFDGGKQPWEFAYLTILISELTPQFATIVRSQGFVHQFARGNPLVRLLDHCAGLMRERGGMIDKYTRSALAYQFIMEMMRYFDPEVRNADFQPLVAKALRFIEERIAEKISLRDIARHIGAAPETVIRAFHNQMKTTPIQFLILKRIERAKNLLTETDLPIKTIADRAGFATERYFCQCFRRHAGCTPGEYRANGFGELFAVERYRMTDG